MVKKILLILLLSSSAQAIGATEKIIYHLHNSGNIHFRQAITNLENLQKGMPEETLDIKLLLQGKGIFLLVPVLQKDNLKQRLGRLRDNGVSVEVGQKNYQQNMHLLEQANPPRTVQNIFSRIIELQHQGYKYITP